MQDTDFARVAPVHPEMSEQGHSESTGPDLPENWDAPQVPRLPSQFDSIVWLISESPGRFVVFERLGIPWYSDEGDSALFEVCARHGLDVHQVIEDLLALDARCR